MSASYLGVSPICLFSDVVAVLTLHQAGKTFLFIHLT